MLRMPWIGLRLLCTPCAATCQCDLDLDLARPLRAPAGAQLISWRQLDRSSVLPGSRASGRPSPGRRRPPRGRACATDARLIPRRGSISDSMTPRRADSRCVLIIGTSEPLSDGPGTVRPQGVADCSGWARLNRQLSAPNFWLCQWSDSGHGIMQHSTRCWHSRADSGEETILIKPRGVECFVAQELSGTRRPEAMDPETTR